MASFKVGDRVRNLKSPYVNLRDEGVVDQLSSNGELVYVNRESTETPGKFRSYAHYWYEIELIGPEKAATADVRFILQYELDRDPFETFATLKEVEERIKELAKRADLKRESIKVYEIAKTYDVKLETRVIFGPRVTLTEKPVKRSVKKRA